MICGHPCPLCTHYPQISTATAEQSGGSSALTSAAIRYRFCLGGQLSCVAPATLKLARYRPLSFCLLSISLNLGKASTSGRISAGVPAKRHANSLESARNRCQLLTASCYEMAQFCSLITFPIFSHTTCRPLKALLHITCYGLLRYQLPTSRAVLFYLCICRFPSTSSLPTCSVLKLFIIGFPTS